jgi:hypothetical protein
MNKFVIDIAVLARRLAARPGAGPAKRFMPPRFGRRNLLLAAAIMPMSMLPAFGSRAVSLGQPFRPVAARNLARLFPNPRSAHRLAAAYLDIFPEDRDLGVLMDHLRRRDKALAAALDNGGLRRLRRLVALNVRDDFFRGHTVRIDGWLLSQTEARLCALAALSWDEPSNAQ